MMLRELDIVVLRLLRKRAGATKEQATAWLTELLTAAGANGEPDEDDLVRDLLDRVTGFCSPSMRLFPD